MWHDTPEMIETFDASLSGLMESPTTRLIVPGAGKSVFRYCHAEMAPENMIDECMVVIIFLLRLLSSALGPSKEENSVEWHLSITAAGKTL